MTHEDFSRKPAQRKLNDRTFGLLAGAVLSAAGLLPLVRRHPVKWYFQVPAGAFLVAALIAPAIIAPVQRAWMRFGHGVSNVLAHVMSALLLLVAFAPARLLFRLAGQDPLALRWDSQADTYWLRRDPPGPPPESMTHQF
jgi:hypothetical protein